MSWIDIASQRGVAEVAKQLGYEPRSAAGCQHMPCPACGAERRHTRSGDRRGAVGIPNSKPAIWKCWQCEESGDAIDLVSWKLFGNRFRELVGDQKATVRGWFHLDDHGSTSLPPQRSRKRPSSVAWENAETIYPPRNQVDALWDACVSVDRDDDALAYLGHRGVTGIDALIEHDCVRVLPKLAEVPAWARLGEAPWTVTGHRLLVPLYDWQGELRSFIARSVEFAPAVKSVGSRGFQRRGLVMAGTYARQMLASGAAGYLHRMEAFRLRVLEGEINWLRDMSMGRDGMREERWEPAAFFGSLGIFSGSFTRDVASRVPSKSVVVIATDDDKQGHAYAEQIQACLGDRVTFEFDYQPDDSPVKGAA
jgi:hypothetical protein